MNPFDHVMLQVVGNSGGELCGHYPAKIVILEYMVHDPDKGKDRYIVFYFLDYPLHSACQGLYS